MLVRAGIGCTSLKYQ